MTRILTLPCEDRGHWPLRREGWTTGASDAIYSQPSPPDIVLRRTNGFMTLGTWFLTVFRGRFVGKDEFGNRYYRIKRHGNMRRERRWVAYKGTVEGSKVPPMWHAWLSHTIAEAPFKKSTTQADWQKEHEANPTGTSQAYRPPGALEKGAEAPEAYEAWRPN